MRFGYLMICLMMMVASVLLMLAGGMLYTIQEGFPMLQGIALFIWFTGFALSFYTIKEITTLHY
jgi:hypothetical protein